MNEGSFVMIFKEIEAKAARLHTWKGPKETNIQKTEKRHSKYIKVII
jgi:hypothetical protein